MNTSRHRRSSPDCGPLRVRSPGVVPHCPGRLVLVVRHGRHFHPDRRFHRHPDSESPAPLRPHHRAEPHLEASFGAHCFHQVPVALPCHHRLVRLVHPGRLHSSDARTPTPFATVHLSWHPRWFPRLKQTPPCWLATSLMNSLREKEGGPVGRAFQRPRLRILSQRKTISISYINVRSAKVRVTCYKSLDQLRKGKFNRVVGAENAGASPCIFHQRWRRRKAGISRSGTDVTDAVAGLEGVAEMDPAEADAA